MPDRVAIYARVSSEDQAERQTIEAQLHACRERAAQRGWTVVEEFRDEGVSGSTPFEQRPEGHRLLEAAEAKLFQRVLVLCVDRLSRDVVDAAVIRRELDRRKVPLEFVLQTFDESPEGELMFSQFVAFAQYERRVIGRRTHEGRKRKVREGSYMASTTPYGYRRQRGQLVEHPDQAKVVRQVFKWAREGLGLRAIANRLNEAGVAASPNKKRKKSKWGWQPTTVAKMLRASRYIGQATYDGEPMACPALVDEATFRAAQEAMRRRQRESPRNTKNFYLLQHLVYCGHCGSRYTAKMVWTKEGPRAVYLCRQRTVHGKAAGHENVKWRWRAEELEEPVKEAIRRFLADPRRAAEQMELTAAHLREEMDRLEGQRIPLRARLEALDEEKSRVMDWARRETINEAEMVDLLGKIRADRAEAVAKLEALEAQQAKPDPREVLDALREFWTNYAGALRKFDKAARAKSVELQFKWAEWTEEEWRRAVRYFVNRVVVEDDGILTLEGLVTASPQSR